MSAPHALILEDDPDYAASMEQLLRREGFTAESADSLKQARECLGATPADVVLIDLQLPDGEGLSLMDDELAASSEFVIVTGHASVDTAVRTLRAGALDYLTKPTDPARLKAALANVVRTRRLKREVEALRDDLRRFGCFGPMVGASPAMQRVYDLIARVAATVATVLITGESGTGKELAAETIHRFSRRRDAPFVAVNCGAISPNLIESELFGHEKGSFTGADRKRVGLFEQANGGTLFLDEVTEMPLDLQVKLLRLLESSQVTRVGSSIATPIDVRVIAASNRDPEGAVREGRLREDLFYRLQVFPVPMPPLRERPEDVELLANHFLGDLNKEAGVTKRWSAGALDRLRRYAWPGNVRELRNIAQRAFIMADGDITVAALACLQGAPAKPASGDSVVPVPMGASLDDAERQVILATLDHCGGNKNEAARLLGVSLKTLYNRLNVYRAAEAGSADSGRG